jgi:hypothetical protein
MVQAALLDLELTYELDKIRNMEKLNERVPPAQAQGGSKPIFEDVIINVKVKISALWVTLMFFYLYADVLTFYQPGTLEEIMAGEIAGMQINQVFSLTSAIVMAIPSVMVFLSLTLKAKANRWTNIIAGIYSAVVLLTANLLVPGVTYGIFYGIVEAVLIALIVGYAWKWPKQEG